MKVNIVWLLLMFFIISTACQSYASRRYTPYEQCLVIQRAIDGALEQYALVNRIPVDQTLSLTNALAFLKSNDIPKCPSGGKWAEFITVSREQRSATNSFCSFSKEEHPSPPTPYWSRREIVMIQFYAGLVIAIVVITLTIKRLIRSIGFRNPG